MDERREIYTLVVLHALVTSGKDVENFNLGIEAVRIADQALKALKETNGQT
jgi:hypothetical protein